MAPLSAVHSELLSIGSRYSGKWTYALTDLVSAFAEGTLGER